MERCRHAPRLPLPRILMKELRTAIEINAPPQHPPRRSTPHPNHFPFDTLFSTCAHRATRAKQACRNLFFQEPCYSLLNFINYRSRSLWDGGTYQVVHVNTVRFKMEIIIGVLVIFVIVIVIGKVLKLAFKLAALVFVVLLILFLVGLLGIA